MKIIPTNTCRLISERISEIFRNSQNKKPTIIKNKFGFKLNLGIISFRLCRKESLVEFSTQLNLGIFQFEWSGGAGSTPALHSFLSYIYQVKQCGCADLHLRLIQI